MYGDFWREIKGFAYEFGGAGQGICTKNLPCGAGDLTIFVKKLETMSPLCPGGVGAVETID